MRRIALGLLLLVPVPAIAQESTPLSPDAAASMLEFYNDPSTTRVQRETRIAAGATVDGNVASLGGPLVVEGTIRGDVVVINGDLRLLPGARIDGEVRVAGGRIEGPSGAMAGGYTLHHEPIRFRVEGDRLLPPEPGRPGLAAAGRPTWFGRTDLVATVDGSYNRVEGLPISVGPRIQLGHSNPTVLEARLSYRTRNGIRVHRRDLGHDVGIEQYIGGHRGIALGLGLHRSIDPIEDAGITDTENSLATFVLHQDHRDHYRRHGWRAHVRFVGATRPYQVRVEYRDESHQTVDPGTPWSLLRNDSPWRPQPLVAEGDLRSIVGRFEWDGRNHAADPSAGWLVRVEVEQGLGGSLVHPGDGRPADAEFTFASLDARRYLRIGPRSRLAVRAMAAGAPDAGPLPPQRQRSLGGEGQLPGYRRFAFDCGARAAHPGEAGFFPYYGCDRAVLLQAEYRFALLPDPPISRRLGLDFDLFGNPELVVFADAGRAWTQARGLDGRVDAGPRRLRPDLGVGLRMGPLGAYIATSLMSEGHGANFFVRLGPRF